MRASFQFQQETLGLGIDQIWLAVVRHRGEPYANQLAPEGSSVVVCFPDSTSVFVNDLNSGFPRVEIRS